ncbi:MAG TPA: TauD/TfdA family dioxygenase [Hyphomicrobiaceae bacterium]|nr:TauD/TfdA family dioxygenase [Hyphomicrobiaceae bacterium]
MALEIKQLHRDFVAEIGSVDLSKPISSEALAELQQAIDRYAVLVFHGPRLSEEDQAEFALRFGELESQNGVLTTDVKRRISPKLVDISNLDEDNKVLGREDRRRMFALGNQLWHTDSSFKRVPAKYSLLHAHSVTPEGGETQLVDMRAAYDRLSPKMKARVDGRIVEHSIFTSRAKLGFTEFSAEERRTLPPVHRDLVRVHPGSGRNSLYLASHASHIVGEPLPDGRMLIADLMEQATLPEHVYTHRWAVGDLVMWDNRCTMHRGRPYDEAANRRDMRRATTLDRDPAAADKRVA